MKKTFTILIAAIAAILMMALPMKVWATTDQVTSQTATNNGEYVIAIYYNGDYYALPKASTMSSATTYAGTKLTLNSLGKVNTSDASDITWKLVENSNTSGQFYIQQTINNTTYYLYKNGTTSSTNYNIKTVTSGQHYWTFAQQSNQYKTYTVKSERGSACQYLTNTANTSTFSVRGSTNSYITLLAVGDATPCTVTLGDDNTQLTETSAGAGVTLPSRSDVSPYTFAGWITSNITTETTTAPATIITAGPYYPTEDITLYPVYTRTEGGGSTTGWELTDLDDADAGVYALLTDDYHAFNGTISSGGHGGATTNAFSFTNSVATEAPDGVCEITFTAVSDNNEIVGYTMYNSGSGKGYLYASKASSGGLAWHSSEDSYWKYVVLNTEDNWQYQQNYSGSKAVLRGYSNSSFRTYSSNNGTTLKLAKKVTVTTGTTYYISVVSTGEPTIVAANVEILYNATSGSITYSINDEPDPAGTLSAAVKAGTTSTIANLVFGNITDDEVPFTCNVNDAYSAHTATVTLTYTYGNNETVTKDVTITQAAAPVTLSSITLSGDYPTTFYVDDDFSHEGMTVTATFSDNSTQDVTASSVFTGYNMSQTGEQTVTVTYTNNDVSRTQTYTITVNPILDKTIAEFIAAGGGKCYLTGDVSNIVNTTYGNFDLTDESGTIYVYGCLTSTGQSQQFSSLGIEEGDKIKVLANEYVYFNNTTHEAKNVRFVEEIVLNTRTLTVSATNGSVEITGKTLDNGSCEVNEGASVTATATPANHYTFTSWTAEGVTLADATANPLTFTMPTNDVTLTASFTENAKHNATFYVLGGISGTDSNVYEGDAITFPSVTAPNGYTFMGWTTSSIVGIQDDAPNVLVNSANMGNDNIDYYAVFAIQAGGDEGTVELTNSTIQTNREGKTSYGNYTIDDWSGKFMINKNGEVYSLQLGYNADPTKSAYNSHLTTPECPYNISSITISTNNNTANGRTFYLCSASNLGTASSTDATYGSGSTAAADGSVTINVSGNTKQFHIYPNGTAYIASVTLTYSNVSYSSYCTTVNALDDNILPLNQSFELENDFTITTGTYYLDTYVIVPDGITLTVGGTLGNSDPDFLVIEDGGRLIVHNEGVQATVQKNINAYTTDKNGWYFIASPVNNASFNTAITSGDNNDYDLYMLDWDNSQWLNKKNNEHAELFANGFQRGTGYLYASEAGNTLSVAGEIQPLSDSDNATVTLATTGWNLIGNPLTCKVTVDKAFSELNNGSSVTSKSAESAINPYQGIAVYGNAGTTVTFTKAATQNAAAPSNTAALQMTLAKNITSRGTASTKVVDNAVVNFNSESSLPKFTMLEGSAKLYFPMEDADYAIVSSDGHGTMPVNFKAKEMGRYTISVETEGIDMSYLHLIDRLTGEDVNLLLDNEYSFIASNNDSEERFILSFTEKGYDAHGNEIFVYQSGNDLIVNGEGELQIFDVMGRMVKNTVINGVEAIAMPQGVYIFRLNENIQKIVVR
jgi:uncharacterized repeat protein (TIGR02543 family)